nr:ankyrin repeat-containing protein BDA1-like [Quercus suber]
MTQIRQEDNDMIELYKAAGTGCKTTLDRLILEDPYLLNKISLTSLSETPLHISALVGHLEFSKALLLLKPQLTRELDSHRCCPLHLASAEGHTEIVQALLDENKDACLVSDQDGRIPLHYAAMRGRVEVVRQLIIAQPNSITQVVLDGGETVLHLCVKYNQLDSLKLLVEFVSDEADFLNSKDHEGGNTVLHLAVMLQRIEIVKYLLSVSKVKEGADALNKMGLTALEVLNHYPKDWKSFTIQNIFMDACAVRITKKNNLSPSLEIVVGHHDSAKRKRSSKKGWNKWFKYLRYQGDWLEETRGALMVVATVITTITFQPAVNPLGGVLQPKENDYYGVSASYTKLRYYTNLNSVKYLSHVMNVATPTKDCLELVNELLVPIIKAKSEKSLTRQEGVVLGTCII